MAMPALPPDLTRRWTAQEVLDLPPDGSRYEVVRGELLVTPAPAPRHQKIVMRLYDRLRAYLGALDRSETVFCLPADISWDASTLVQPDLFVVLPEEASDESWSTYKTLLLAVEVLSPSSGRADRVVKRQLYQAQGVSTYWIIDPDAELAEVWHPEDERPEIVTGTLRWQLAPELPTLEIEVAALMERSGRDEGFSAPH